MMSHGPSLRLLLIVLGSLLAPALTASAEDKDILVADFEGEDYGEWKAEGEAFGPGPAAGTLPNQMEVSGFEGKRLVNSFFRGDATTGTLTSPEFKIERKYLNFLVGGGKHAETRVDLLLDGKVVRTATGPNDRPGGSERLDWHTWDVADLSGRTVTIHIVDEHAGGWGHINVDHIVQSDRRWQAEPARRELVIEKRYLHLPVKTGATMRRATFAVDGRTVREFDIEYAEGKPDFFAFSDVGAFRGTTLTVMIDRLPSGSEALASIMQSDEVPSADALYDEPRRPQFHFTSRRGWLNDPNGLIFHDGEYHLFYQHNPFGWAWGNMHWGHAVSRDLVRWKELPIALYPRRYGDWAFSGSAVVDERNTSGFGTAENPPLVAAYTSTGRGECVVYSTDRGRTWTEYEGNPVVRHAGRDPKLLWHEPTGRWVMAVYDEEGGKQAIAFYTSPDLKSWEYQSRIDGFFECPDLFELPVQGADGKRSRWILYAADGKYLVGDFDGRAFKPESGKHTLWHGNFYAAQTFSDTPDGRRVQVGWARGVEFRGMPFNQQMTVPVVLTLRATADGPRMFAEPVEELESLRRESHAHKDLTVDGETPLEGVNGDLFDITAEFDPGSAASCGLLIRGVPVNYDAKKRELTCHNVTAPVASVNGRIRLRILADRGSLEVFANDGAAAISAGVILPDGERSVVAFARGGAARFHVIEMHKLSSAWE